MASGTAAPPQPAETQPLEAQYEAFIEDRLRQTRRQVKGVDLFSGLLTLAVGTLAYLLAAAVIDHWLVTGGLGFWGRLLLFAGLLGGVGWYVARWILPPLVYRINPVFAAHTIEQSRPTLKNSLINFLLLRGHRREVPQVVYRALQHRAAADLSQVEIEVAVDRTHVVRLGCLLAGVVAVCCLYLLLSPKSPLSSAARVIWPWAGTKAPTRVTIDDVVVEVDGRKVALADDIGHHSVTAFHGEFVTVSAEVHGLGDGEQVELRYSTTDGQSVDQAIPMTLPKEAYRHQGDLPPGDLGLQQDLLCYLRAGDCTTPRFTIIVQTAPAILIDRIDYDYPDYTGLADRSVQRQGDIREIEGTKVTIWATANQEIGRAEIDFDCDWMPGQKMKADANKANGRFELRLSPDDPTRPEHDCYQLLFSDTAGRPNPRPIRHRIEVIRDLPPEIQLVYPLKDDVEVLEDGAVEIRVRAEDPDFALRRVLLQTDCNGKDLAIPPLLDRPQQGEFLGAYRFEPARLKLKAGDRVLYWVEAEDNKQPYPGRGETVHQWITVVGPESPRPPQERPDAAQHNQQQRPEDQPPDPSQRPEQSPQEDPSQDPAEEPQPGEEPQNGAKEPKQDQDVPDQEQSDPQGEASQSPDGTGQSKSGTSGEKQDQASDEPGEPIDSETQEGDAFEEIIEHLEEQKEDQQPPGSQQSDNQQQSGDQQQTGDQPQSGDQQQTGDQPQSGDQQQTGNQPQSGDQQQTGDQPQSGDQQQTGNQPQSGDQQQTGDQPQSGDQQQTGDQPQSGDQQQTGNQPQSGDQQQTGDQPQSGDQQQTGDQPQSGDQQQTGDQPRSGQDRDQPKAGGEGQPQSSPGAGKPSEDKTGSPSPQGDNQERDKKPGQGSQGQPDQKQESAESPGIDPKQSESQSETPGDRSGGGGKGGGQQANQPGVGSPGSNTPAEEGASQSNQPGNGETGKRAGNQVETDQQTGKSTKREGGGGSDNQRQQPGGQGAGKKPNQRNDSSSDGNPMQNPPDGGKSGQRVSHGPGAHGQGNPTVGGGPDKRPETTPPSDPQAKEPGGDDPNLEYANKATDLALEHLKDQMDRADSNLLDRLGWSPEEAKEFIKRWEQMKRAAAQGDTQGKTARGSLDEALKSLGLRPHGTQLRGDETQSDQLRGMRESGRYAAPGDWNEWLKAYTRGVAGGGR